MKKLTILLAVVLAGSLIMGCAPKKPVKTIENLTAAYNGESTASAKYAQFVAKAFEEGFDTIAKMFEATSKAEAVHAGNHKKVLEKLGEQVGDPVIGSFEVLTTSENLTDAITGETYEIETMYPEFISVAVTEDVPDAKKSFTWALDTEKKHQQFYQRGLEAANAGSEINLPLAWYICPVCGNTYDEATLVPKCDFCQTEQEKFFVF